MGTPYPATLPPSAFAPFKRKPLGGGTPFSSPLYGVVGIVIFLCAAANLRPSDDRRPNRQRQAPWQRFQRISEASMQ